MSSASARRGRGCVKGGVHLHVAVAVKVDDYDYDHVNDHDDVAADGELQEPSNMICDEAGLLLKHLECRAQRSVAFFDGFVEAIMGGSLLGQLPDALDAVELGRVRRKPEQLDAVPILGQPLLSLFFEIVAGAVVDDQEDLASATPNDLLQEIEERESVEDGSEAVVKLGLLLDGDHAEDVRGLA
jgi:hypothetical protein